MSHNETTTDRVGVKAHFMADVETLLAGISGVKSAVIQDHAEQDIGIDIYRYAVDVEYDTATDVESEIDDLRDVEVVSPPQSHDPNRTPEPQ